MSSVISSGAKIFDVIEVLLSNPKTREDATMLLEKKGIKTDKNTISKYIRTLRQSGFEIDTNETFKILKTPFKITLNKNEEKGYYYLLEAINSLFDGNMKQKSELFEKRIENLITNKIKKEDVKIDPSISDKTLYLLEENLAKWDFVLLKINFLGHYYKVIPLKLNYKTNGTFLSCYDIKERKNKTLRVDLIKNVIFVKVINENLVNPYNKTVFKITGRLKKNYILKSGEVAKYLDDEVIITNVYEEKDELFDRLIRYGKYCEIIYPESDRKKFKKKLEDLIKHYNSI